MSITVELSPRGARLHQDVDAAQKVIASDPEVYKRDTQLVTVVRVDDDEDRFFAAGSPVIRALPEAVIRERLTRHATWLRYYVGSKEMEETSPPGDVITALAGRGQWKDVRPLLGVLEAPALRPDGTVLQEAGYDHRTRHLYAPSATFPPVPDEPTQAEAQSALEQLREVFGDFPFRSDAEREVMVAAVLTMFARPAIPGAVPAVVLDASTRGSGKSLASDTVSVIATGRQAARMSYPSDKAELEKVLGAYALRGAPLIVFDNMTCMFGGGPLDKVLTAQDRVDLRVLGKSELPSVRWRSLVVANGNNVVLGADTTRRVLVARLEPQVENPEDRTDFRHPQLLSWLSERRPRLARAALTILRAYVVAGRPDMGTGTWGSFEDWATLVPPAIVFAGGADVTPCRPTKNGDGVDPTLEALRVLVERWQSFEQAHGQHRPDGGTRHGMLGRDIVRALWPAPAHPDGLDDIREALEALCRTHPGHPPSPKQLGKALNKHRGRVVAGKRIQATTDASKTKRWTVEVAGG